jgi:threonine synthase
MVGCTPWSSDVRERALWYYEPMTQILYRDTRGLSPERLPFTEAVVRGIAPGGGLYVPESLPTMTVAEIVAWGGISYASRAADLFRRFGVDLPAGRIGELAATAYGSNFDDPRIAPVVTVAPGMHVLELWHGPTSAFKDMALQCMPVFFSEAVETLHRSGKSREEYLILVATSGDTGKAALEGFADRPHTGIVVFYPAEGVSELQRLQMVTQRGGNVGVFGVRGNFDDCQNAVKATFADESFAARLKKERRLLLSSANSINWGRLLPQIVYYVSAYADLVAAGSVAPGDPVDVCVPTGNFGNILGAWYAKRIGTPIDRLLCASNENNVLTDFIASGTYDIASRPFVKTPSPSMDILISSNLERLLFEITGDAARVRGWIGELAKGGRFSVGPEVRETIGAEFTGGFVTNDESLATIRRVRNEWGYLLDPHTAVAWRVAERLRGEHPVLVAATAHWAKFGADVRTALLGLSYGAPLPPEDGGSGPVALLRTVSELLPGASIPPPLSGIESLPIRFSGVIDAGKGSVEAAVEGWLNALSGPDAR